MCLIKYTATQMNNSIASLRSCNERPTIFQRHHALIYGQRRTTFNLVSKEPALWTGNEILQINGSGVTLKQGFGLENRIEHHIPRDPIIHLSFRPNRFVINRWFQYIGKHAKYKVNMSHLN